VPLYQVVAAAKPKAVKEVKGVVALLLLCFSSGCEGQAATVLLSGAQREGWRTLLISWLSGQRSVCTCWGQAFSSRGS
jgi:hypothetical protein